MGEAKERQPAIAAIAENSPVLGLRSAGNAHVSLTSERFKTQALKLISKSALGLQNLLNCLHKFYEKWKMKVNTTKTKCVTFQKKNKVNKSEIFIIGKANLSNVAEFVYLGLKINAAGSFKESLNLLGDKAKRACFSLNKNFKLKDIPIKIALKLFDATRFYPF